MAENSPNDPIIIDLNSEYKIKIEKGNDFSSSIFKEVYETAKSNVKEIILNAKQNDKHDTYNNIIAFTGERGKGKSSTMISFLESLIHHNQNEHQDFFRDEKWDSINFESVDVIDPSLFRGKETLFEIVIAKMFGKFRQKVEKDSNDTINDENRRELIKHFQNVFENLKYVNNREDLYKQDALDALIKLSTSSNLKESFEKLVSNYLNVLGRNDHSNFLVIAIDDFDLKIDGIYEMLEDLRQFLISKKIIILVSYKHEQLIEKLNDKYSLKYTSRYPNDFESHMESMDIASIKSIKYLEKLIPINRRIVLSNIDELLTNKFHLFYNGNLLFRSDESNYLKFENSLRAIIFEKLGIYLPNRKSRINYVFPQTLRELIEFLSFLKSNSSLQSLKSFSNYLKSKIGSSEGLEIINKLDNSNKNSLKTTFLKIVDSLKYYNDNQIYDQEKLNLLYQATNDELISIGDIATLLNVLETDSSIKSNYLLLDTIETYFNVELKLKNVSHNVPEIYNGIIKIFRSNKSWYLFNYTLDRNPEDVIKRMFIHYVGSYSKTKYYREYNDNPFLISNYKIYSTGSLTPLSFLGNFVFFNLIEESFVDFFLSNQTYSEELGFIKEQFLSFSNSIYYNLLQQPSFIKDFISEIQREYYVYKQELPKTDEEILLNFGFYKQFEVLENLTKMNGLEDKNKTFDSNVIFEKYDSNVLLPILKKLNLYIPNSLTVFRKAITDRMKRYFNEGDITSLKLTYLKTLVGSFYDDHDNYNYNQIVELIDNYKIEENISDSAKNIKSESKSIKRFKELERDIINLFRDGQSTQID